MESHTPSLLGQGTYINYLEFLCKWDLSQFFHVFIYSTIYLNQYGFTDIYFILWIIIQYFFILLLKLFQLWPLGAFLKLVLVFLWHTHLPICGCFCLLIFLICVLFSEYVLFLALQDDLGSSSIFCHMKKKNPCALPPQHPLPQKTLIITALLVITIFFPFPGCHIGA